MEKSLNVFITSLGRFLRRHGFRVSVADESEALQGLLLYGLTDALAFRLVMKSTLVKNAKEHREFDQLYLAFCKEYEKGLDSKQQTDERPTAKPGNKKDPEVAFRDLKNWLFGSSHSEIESIAAYDAGKLWGQLEFTRLSEQEQQLLAEWVKQWARRLYTLHSRRWRPASLPKILDIRRTLQRNLQRGQEVIDLVYKEPKPAKLNVVAICDVSRSMQLYSRFFIHFLYAMQQGYPAIETFAFSTSLYRLTPYFRKGLFETAIEGAAQEIKEWNSGTRIGECLMQYTREYGRYAARSSRTVTVILSDGWDTGDPELLEQAMQSIRQKSKMIIWLNPLAGSASYNPETFGMKTALPYIDWLLPFHNMESLKELVKIQQKIR